MSVLTAHAWKLTNARGEEMRATIENGSSIRVNWRCGDNRIFSPDALRQAIDAIGAMAQHSDAWTALDAYGGRIYVRANGEGEITVNTTPVDNGWFRWKDVRKLCGKAIGACGK